MKLKTLLRKVAILLGVEFMAVAALVLDSLFFRSLFDYSAGVFLMITFFVLLSLIINIIGASIGWSGIEPARLFSRNENEAIGSSRQKLVSASAEEYEDDGYTYGISSGRHGWGFNHTIDM